MVSFEIWVWVFKKNNCFEMLPLELYIIQERNIIPVEHVISDMEREVPSLLEAIHGLLLYFFFYTQEY